MSKKTPLDEDEIPDIKRKKMVLPIQCGHCIFHKQAGTYTKGDKTIPCIQLGTPASADPCVRFTPIPSTLGADAAKYLRVLGAAAEPTLLVAIMLSAKRVKRTVGFSIGDLVYLRVMGGDYLCNYASGVVAGATHDGRVVLLGREGYTAFMLPESLMLREAWEDKRARLIQRSAVNDPGGGLRHLTVKGANKLMVYEPNPISAKVKRRRARNKTYKAIADKNAAKRKGGITYIGAGKPDED